MMKKL